MIADQTIAESLHVLSRGHICNSQSYLLDHALHLARDRIGVDIRLVGKEMVKLATSDASGSTNIIEGGRVDTLSGEELTGSINDPTDRSSPAIRCRTCDHSRQSCR